ncbi:MAG: ABC transporter ATP-binding protein [Bacilli bacterium]
MKTALKTNNLTKTFKDFVAVNAINLTVPEGAIYGFLGPNGAGKTTTLKMLAGMTKPTSGTIEIFGEEVAMGSLLKRSDIGFLPDVPGFYDWMRAKEYLEFCGSLYHIVPAVRRTRAKEVLKQVGLSKVANKKIGTFSRGMKQRLGIAQALINNPRIVFLDEPVSALDPTGRKEVMEIIASLRGKVTVFFSTHILADVERICDRVVIIDQGKVVLEDSMENIKTSELQHIIEVEVQNGESTILLQEIDQAEWLKEVIIEGKSLKLDVLNIDQARRALYQIFTKHDLKVKRFIIVEPTLEDVFLKAVHHV